MNGTVSWMDPGGKPIGFIQPEGTSDRDNRVFFHKNMIADVAQKNSVGVGSEVNYTLGPPSDKGPRAATVEVLTAGIQPAASPTPNSNPNPTNHTNSAPAPRPAGARIRKMRSVPDEALTLDEFRVEFFDPVVKVSARFNAPSMKVDLRVNSDIASQPHFTEWDGTVEFSFPTESGENVYDIELEAEGAVWSRTWTRYAGTTQPAPAPPPQPAEPIDDGQPNQLRFVEGNELFRQSRFTILTSFNGTPHQGTVTFLRLENSRGLTNLLTNERVNSVPITWQTDDQGRLLVQVHCWGARTEVDAELEGNPQTKQTITIKGGR